MRRSIIVGVPGAALLAVPLLALAHSPDPKEAEQIVRAIVAACPGQRALAERAASEFYGPEYQAALAHYERVARCARTVAIVHVRMGFLKVEAGDFSSAEARSRKAVTLAPSFTNRLSLLEALTRQNKPEAGPISPSGPITRALGASSTGRARSGSTEDHLGHARGPAGVRAQAGSLSRRRSSCVYRPGGTGRSVHGRGSVHGQAPLRLSVDGNSAVADGPLLLPSWSAWARRSAIFPWQGANSILAPAAARLLAQGAALAHGGAQLDLSWRQRRRAPGPVGSSGHAVGLARPSKWSRSSTSCA